MRFGLPSLLKSAKPVDGFTAFLSASSLNQLNTDLLEAIRRRGFSYSRSNEPSLIPINKDAGIVGILEYTTTGPSYQFLDKVMIPDSSEGGAYPKSHYFGTTQLDQGFLDDLIAIMQTHGLSLTPIRTTEQTFQIFGMREYYEIFGQYAEKYRQTATASPAAK